LKLAAVFRNAKGAIEAPQAVLPQDRAGQGGLADGAAALALVRVEDVEQLRATLRLDQVRQGLGGVGLHGLSTVVV